MDSISVRVRPSRSVFNIRRSQLVALNDELRSEPIVPTGEFEESQVSSASSRQAPLRGSGAPVLPIRIRSGRCQSILPLAAKSVRRALATNPSSACIAVDVPPLRTEVLDV